MARLVYRGGPNSDDNLTPRPDKDTIGKSGQAPGLSTFDSLEKAAMPGQKAQVFDLDLLPHPLRGYPDDPSLGGTEGHVSIAPQRADGEIDPIALSEWAAARKTGRPHELTNLLRKAKVNEEDVRRPR